MLLITCPFCGPRDEIEFRCGGEAARPRPDAPGSLDDRQWADFLFMRRNEKGARRERWNHAAGCRRWFDVRRDTTTHAFLADAR
jgi:sarcosine oxidase, subunit delta